jgi:hypothetical protein
MVACLVRAALATPAYLSVAWALMVSYQIFTETAVKTVVNSIGVYSPLLGNWLSFRIDMIVFIYAFAWVFVLSSIIPSLILGKERSVIVQFIVCLGLTLSALVLIDILKGYGWDFTNQTVLLANPYLQIFANLFFAAFYLSLPYLLMLGIDLKGRKKHRQQEERVKKLTDEYFQKQAGDKEDISEKPSP